MLKLLGLIILAFGLMYTILRFNDGAIFGIIITIVGLIVTWKAEKK